MSDSIIEIDCISKLYRLGELGTGSLTHDLNRWWHRVLGRDDPYLKIGQKNDRTRTTANSNYVWALKDVSFNLKRGEVLGIIGRNGAGKSTLLKILSRVTRPTSGKIRVKGRVASLLEVGTGFHPELTGRENVYLNGAILGMSRLEIHSKFNDIVGFSGCSAYIDTPVKRYSSGMKVRLGFAVAAYLNPDILIVDEVLAVGDAEFQKQCLSRMDDLRNDGRSVIFVSHQMGLVQALCSRAVRMAEGQVISSGDTASIIGAYLSENDAEADFTRHQKPHKTLQIVTASASATTPTHVDLRLKVHATQETTASLDIRIKEASTAPVGFTGLGSLNDDEMIHFKVGINHLHVRLRSDALANGSYLASLDLTHPNVEYFDRVEDCLRFTIDRPPAFGAQRTLLQSWGYGSFQMAAELREHSFT